MYLLKKCLLFHNLFGMDEKEKAKQILMEKLKGMKIKSDNPNTIQGKIKNQPNQYPIPLQRPSTVLNPHGVIKKDERQQQVNQKIQGVFEEPFNNKQQENPKEYQRKVLKTRRPYYQHYSKEGIYQPSLQYIQNHRNPSGKPPDIPEYLTQGIQVTPKRPWVYFGPQNIPPTDCQDINQKNFAMIFQKARKEKKQNSGILKKSVSKKKNKNKHDDDISEISDDFTSNFTFTDSADLSKESDLISEFRSQTRTNKNNYQESQLQDESVVDSSMAGSAMQKQKYNLFDSSDSDKESQSVIDDRKKKKKKVMFDSSDSEGQKNKKSGPRSEVDSSMGISEDEQIESSVKVDIDDDSIYTSRRNSERPKRTEKRKSSSKKIGVKETKGKGRGRKMKEESSIDQDDS